MDKQPVLEPTFDSVSERENTSIEESSLLENNGFDHRNKDESLSVNTSPPLVCRKCFELGHQTENCKQKLTVNSENNSAQNEKGKNTSFGSAKS